MEVEIIGLQVRFHRQCHTGYRSPATTVSPKKPNNGGHFANDLLTGLGAARACRLSFGPFLSKAVDCRI